MSDNRGKKPSLWSRVIVNSMVTGNSAIPSTARDAVASSCSPFKPRSIPFIRISSRWVDVPFCRQNNTVVVVSNVK